MRYYTIQTGDIFITHKVILGSVGYNSIILADVRYRILYHYYYNNFLFLRLMHGNGEIYEIDLNLNDDYEIISYKKEERIKKIKSILE